VSDDVVVHLLVSALGIAGCNRAWNSRRHGSLGSAAGWADRDTYRQDCAADYAGTLALDWNGEISHELLGIRLLEIVKEVLYAPFHASFKVLESIRQCSLGVQVAAEVTRVPTAIIT
jgi:hypothetical protein